MPNLPPRFNYGSEIKNVNPTLYNQLNDSFQEIAFVMRTKPSVAFFTYDPSANATLNAQFNLGDMWVNQTSNAVFMLTNRTTSNAVVWTAL